MPPVTEIFFWCIYVFGTIGALFRPVYGVLLYVMVYNLNPETQWWGANVAASGIRTSLTVALCLCIGLVLNWKPMRDREQQFPLMLRFMFCFIGLAFFSSMSSLYPLGNMRSQFLIDKLVRVCLFIIMMIRTVRTSEDFRWLLWSWLGGTVYIGYEAWQGVGIVEGGRLTGGLGGPDFAESSGLAAHLTAMVALAGFMFYSSRTKRGKLFALLAAAFAVNTIVLTRTRNAFPGMIFMIGYGVLRLPRGLRFKCFIGILMGILFATQLTDEGWWRRMETMKNPNEDASIQSRIEFWKAAVRMVRDYPFGIGPGQFRSFSLLYIPDLEYSRSGHSTYFECLAEMGYLGIIIFLCVIFATFYQIEMTRRAGRQWQIVSNYNPELSSELRDLLLMATANEVAIGGYLVCGMFTTRLWTEGLWLLLAQSCCLYNISRRLVEEQQPYVEAYNKKQQAMPSSLGVAV